MLSINFGLLALVVRQLTGSRWAALMALLALGINPAFSGAYFDTGPIYDVLAYAFFWGAFAWYVKMRQAGRLPGAGRLALLLCLLAAALNAKEISVALPVAVALYELVWHPPVAWTFRELRRWVCHEGRYAAIGFVFDAAFIAGKRYGPDSLWDYSAYHPAYSATAYVQSIAHYLRALLYKPVSISMWEMAALLALMVAIAAFTRRRALSWGIGYILLGVLPLAFIPLRTATAYLVPSLGWAVYCTDLMNWLMERLAGQRTRLRVTAQILSLVLAFATLAPWQRRWIGMHELALHEMQARFLRYRDQIHALIPAPRKGARILLLADADGKEDRDIEFLIQLSYGDPTLRVERMTMWTDRQVEIDRIKYDYALDWDRGKFMLYSPQRENARDPEPPPVSAGIYDDLDRAVTYRGGWIRDGTFAQPNAHSVTYTNVPDSQVSFRFRGDTITYVYTKASNRGRADIAIDGVRKMTVDLYSPVTLWQSRTTFAHLGPGEHLLTLTVLPDSDPESSGGFVDVDAFEVVVGQASTPVGMGLRPTNSDENRANGGRASARAGIYPRWRPYRPSIVSIAYVGFSTAQRASTPACPIARHCRRILVCPILW